MTNEVNNHMARKNRNITKASKNIRNIVSGISDNMDTLYRSTYMSNPQQNRDLINLNDEINNSIDRIVDKNVNNIGIPSVSKLYTRAAASSSGSSSNNKVVNELEKMFDNGLMTDDLYGLFMSNRYLKELDNEIDTVCKYMTKLEEALAVQKDCILSADHFSKDFLNLEYPSNGDDAIVFAERAIAFKKKYKLAKLCEEIYDNTSKYGEQFVYRVPYSIAIGKLLANKPDGEIISPTRIGESSIDNSNSNKYFSFTLTESKCTIKNLDTGYEEIKSNPKILTESVKKVPNGNDVTEQVMTTVLDKNESFNIAIEINKSNIIESVVKGYDRAYRQKGKIHESSMSAMYESSINDKNNNIADGNVHFYNDKKDERIIANDGLITGDENKIIDVKSPGCVVRKLQRDQVVPIYIEDICMGYYYFELCTMDENEAFMGFKNVLGDPITNGKVNDSRGGFNTVDNLRQDNTLKYVAGELSKFIDKQFVNANQDLAREIYMILKYNDLFNTPSIDTIKVTFIPPEDMVHFFFKQDPITHRGISDLANGLIPAKIYASLYITNSIGNLTRGYDRRVYYVKQSVDTNIAQTLLNTIAQIKQSNFGIRQFQNINNILNITGRFNDFVIPTNASGDPPIQFEIMPGQNIEAPTELMEKLESMAINSTGIPMEILEVRQSIDYAMQLTMSSSKVLRFCYKRQELFEDLLTELIAPIYMYEYDESVQIKVTLPPSTFINVTNTNQLVDNTKNFVDSIADIELESEENDKLKSNYRYELFKHYIGTHIDIAKHKKIFERCKIETQSNADEAHSDGSNSGRFDY